MISWCQCAPKMSERNTKISVSEILIFSDIVPFFSGANFEFYLGINLERDQTPICAQSVLQFLG